VVGKIYNIFPLKQYLLIIADSIPYNCELYTYVYHMSSLLFYCWGDLTRIWDFTWRVSDCEELVRVTHRRWWFFQ